MNITKNADGTLNLLNVKVSADPQVSSTGKCYLAIKQALKVRGLLPAEPSREVTINVTCYPPVDPNKASASAVDLSTL